MAAKSSKGVKICIVKDGVTGTPVTTVTAVSKAAPAVLTVTGGTAKPGDIIFLPAAATGFSEIDGKYWVAGPATTATSIDLVGSDTTAATATFTAGANPPVQYLATDMECLCLSSIGFNPGSPSTISTATFCNPTGSIASQVVEAGTVDFAGYVDVSTAEYKALDALYNSGNVVTVRVELPGNGYILFSGTVSAFNLSVPIDGAISYSGSITLDAKPRHLYD